jgi:hypothetical protein
MGIINRFKDAIILGAAIVGILVGSTAFAASSITPGVFTKIVGLFVQPLTTSYSYGTQLQTPVVTAASSTNAAGSLTQGRLVVKVAALSLTGTSSPSNEIATSSQGTNSEIQLTWPQVPGATGYAIYIGTSTPGSEQSYLLATSTGGQVNNFYTLVSTSSPTYYAIPGQGAGYYTSANSASTSLDTTGLIRAQQAATTSACATALNGAMFYNAANAHLWLCIGAGPAWTVIK